MRRTLATALGAWPRRRWVAAALALPVAAVLLGASAGAASQARWWLWPALAVAASLAAVVVASYVPRPHSGRRLDVGCSPCAAVAALTLPLAAMALASSPADPTMTAVAVVLLLAGARQRLADSATCPRPR